MSRGPRGPLIAGNFDDLRVIRERAGDALEEPRVDGDGLSLVIERGAFEGSRSLTVRRLAEVLRSTSKSIAGQFDVHNARSMAILGLSVIAPVERSTLDPAWLDWIPSDRVAAGFALAVPPGAGTWDAAFGLADRVERIDPERANVAPLRLRLDLLARSVGVRTESDLLPHLKGVTAWAGSQGRAIDAGLVALHFDDEAAALRFTERIRPAAAPGASGSRPIGQLDGRPIRVARVGRSAAIAWGEGSLASSMAALDDPARSGGPALRTNWMKGVPAFGGGVWPARIPGLIPESSPLADALSPAPPIVLSGFWMGPTHFHLMALWDGLDGSVKRFLERIPMDPPPDR